MQMIDELRHHDYRVIQAVFLGSMGIVLLLFGLSVYAQQFRRGIRPTWPLPGGLVGGTFLIAMGCLPLMMSALRLDLMGWSATGWQQTTVYFLIALCSVATIVRWWRKGLDDDIRWNGKDRRNGRDRRVGWGPKE